MEEKAVDLRFTSQVLVLSHFFLILFIFPYFQFTTREVENFHYMEFEDSLMQTINTVLILSNQ